MKTNEEIMSKVADIITNNIATLKEKPMELHILKNIYTKINNQIYPENKNDKEIVFFRYFYGTFLDHIWFHLAGDASLRVSDKKTKQIVRKVIEGLEHIANAYSNYDKTEIYDSLTTFIHGYFRELNLEE